VNLAELISQTPVVVHDTEFRIRESLGERPQPWCESWMDLRDRVPHRQWIQGVHPSALVTPPLRIRVAYNVAAETSVDLQLGRPVPELGIDLYAEHRALTNGLACGNRLIDAMHFWGLDSMESAHKDLWHDRFINTSAPFPEQWKEGALNYNFEDVDMTARLLEAMAPRIDLPNALLRFRYMVAIAEMQHMGVPVDVDLYRWVQTNWTDIKARMIAACPYDVFDGLSFSSKKFGEFLFDVLGADSWQRTESGRLVLSGRYFEHMAFEYPEISHIHRVKRTLDTFDSFELGIGEDGRNRASWFPFRSKTARNQPKRLNIFSNHSRWVRGLVIPPPGRALCELDYEQQEFGIVAALSEDPNMIASYLSGDPYMALAVMAGAAPEGATKKTHPEARHAYKVTALAVQFGSTAAGIARRLGEDHAEGALLMHHYDTAFETFRAWQRRKRVNSRYGTPMVCPYGWRLFGAGHIKWRTIDNLWAQGTGSEMLRAAAVELRKAGIEIVALIHDAVIIEADESEIEAAAEAAAKIMGDVSEATLRGRLRLRTDKTFVRPGGRLLCPEAMDMWDLVTGPYFGGGQ
jgi:DNA polymerase-1